MPLPDLSPQEIRFAEMLQETAHVRPVREMHDFASSTRARNDYLDVYTAGELVIMHDGDGEWFNELINSGFDINWAMDSFYDSFFKHFEDEYEYLTIVMVADFGIFAAFYQPIANDVKGLGYDNSVGRDTFDNSTTTDIEGLIFMNYYGLWTSDREVSRYVFGQEFMHRWGSFTQVQLDGQDPDVLLGRDTAHWSYWFDTPNSPMEGNHWVNLGNGTWMIDTALSTYSTLDLYLMGLAPAEEVGTQTLLLVEQSEQDAIGRDPTYTPKYLDDLQTRPGDDIIVPATPLQFELSAITAMEGERDPAYGDSPTQFHMPILVLVMSTDTLNDRIIGEIDELRLSWEEDWEADVLGRGDLITTLGSNDAPKWGEETDTGEEDSGEVDSGSTDDTGGGDDSAEPISEEDPPAETPEASGCGCNPAVPVSGWAAAGAFVAAALGRRRK